MTSLALAKFQIRLEQIDLKRESSVRLFMGGLSDELREVLVEIVEGPLSFPKNLFSSDLSSFEELGLIKIEGLIATVDKEMRRRIEGELERFGEEFRPDIISFTQFLRKSVPLHHLPIWYQIPRTAETIEKALVERFFETPELYERMLSDLSEETGFIGEMAKEAYQDHSILVSEISKRFALFGEELEAALLLLEYKMLLFHGYDSEGRRIMKPLHERSDYLKELNRRLPNPLDEAKIIKRDSEPFAYLKSLPRYESDRPLEEQALAFYRDPSNQLTQLEKFSDLASHLAIRVIENSLRFTKESGWVLFEEFLASVRIPAPLFDTVRLVQRGKRYQFLFPEYSQDQQDLIHDVIFERLYQSGMVEVGTYSQKECFKLTPFGAQLLT